MSLYRQCVGFIGLHRNAPERSTRGKSIKFIKKFIKILYGINLSITTTTNSCFNFCIDLSLILLDIIIITLLIK
jgi:hypothetical protein